MLIVCCDKWLRTDRTIYAIITHNVKRQRCPACGCSTKRIHDYNKRTLEHAIVNDVRTVIVFNQRRYLCTCCNKSLLKANSFAYQKGGIHRSFLQDKSTGAQQVEVYFLEAIICIDSFHVVKLINMAFTNIRIRVMKSFEMTSAEYQLLKHFNWVLTKSSSRLDLHETVDLRKYFYAFDTQYPSIGVMIEKMSSFDFDLTAAYSMKEDYAYINSTSTPENAEQRIDSFIGELLLYDVRELRGDARTLKHWKKEIVNSFYQVDGQRISNGPIESVNSRIKIIKQNGNGYRNFERFKLRALYSLNESSSIKN